MQRFYKALSVVLKFLEAIGWALVAALLFGAAANEEARRRRVAEAWNREMTRPVIYVNPMGVAKVAYPVYLM